MLILRCTNGLVAWIFVPTTTHMANAICVNDNFTIEISRTVERGWIEDFRTVFMHTIAVAGAVQQTLFIPSML